MTPRNGASPESQHVQFGCVLHATGPSAQASAAQIVEALSTHEWRTARTASPIDAMALICLHERTQAQRGAWGLPRAERTVLIVPSEDERPSVSRLLDAIATHLPSVIVRTYTGDALDTPLDPLPPPLVLSPPAPEAPTERSPEPPPRAQPAPTPPQAPTPPAPPRAPAPDADDDDEESLAVSREEISMLLDPGFEEPAS